MPGRTQISDRDQYQRGGRWNERAIIRDRPVRRAPPRRDRPQDQDRIPRGTVIDEPMDPYRKIKVAVVVVATVLFLALLPFWISSIWDGENEPGGNAVAVDTFMDGSYRVMVNTTYTGRDAFFMIPGDADVDKAVMKVSGSLPPQKISFQAGRNPADLAVGSPFHLP